MTIIGFTSRALSLACFVTTSMACSCLGRSYVVNATSAPIEVELWLGRSFLASAGGAYRELLAITPQLDTAKPWQSAWAPLDSSVRIDSLAAGLRLTLVLAPSAGLQVGQVAADCAGGVLGFVLPDSMNVRAPARAHVASRDLLGRNRRRSRATYVYAITP